MSGVELLTVLRAMANEPVRNYVVPGLTSQLIGGRDHGRVRLFSSDCHTREWITPHSHRFDFVCLVLRGEVTNLVFREVGYHDPEWTTAEKYAVGTLRRQTGEFGDYVITHGSSASRFVEERKTYATGSSYSMTAKEIHSIRFSAGAEVLFFEGPETAYESVFLEPWCDGRVVKTFAVQPWMFERGGGDRG